MTNETWFSDFEQGEIATNEWQVRFFRSLNRVDGVKIDVLVRSDIVEWE
jgi:hypothetical protein